MVLLVGLDGALDREPLADVFEAMVSGLREPHDRLADLPDVLRRRHERLERGQRERGGRTVAKALDLPRRVPLENAPQKPAGELLLKTARGLARQDGPEAE